MSSIYDEPPLNPVSVPDAQLPARDLPPDYSQPTSPPFGETEQAKGGCGCIGCMLGCLVVLLVITVALGIGTWWFVRKLPEIARGVAENVVDQSELTAEDKKTVKEQIGRLVKGYEQGKIDARSAGEFFEKLTRSPLMNMLVAYAAKVKYIDPSGLTPEEKADAEVTLNRVARGALDEKISKEELDVALNHISNQTPDGGRVLRDTASDEELRAFIKECKAIADKAEIPLDVPTVNIGEELTRIVDDILGETTATVEPEDPTFGSGDPARGSSSLDPVKSPSAASARQAEAESSSTTERAP